MLNLMIALLAGTMVAGQRGADAVQFDAAMTVMLDGAVLGTPSLRVSDGAPAVLTVAGETGYRVEIVVNAAEASEDAVLSQISIYLRDEAAWRLIAEPILTSRLRAPVSMATQSPAGALRLDAVISAAD